MITNDRRLSKRTHTNRIFPAPPPGIFQWPSWTLELMTEILHLLIYLSTSSPSSGYPPPKKKEVRNPIFTWRLIFSTRLYANQPTCVSWNSPIIVITQRWHTWHPHGTSLGLDFGDVIFRNVEVTQTRWLRIHQAFLRLGSGMILLMEGISTWHIQSFVKIRIFTISTG